MERFVIGTGRCGSTLLSRMLAENPAVLSLSEFFVGLDEERRFDPRPVDGAEFSDLLMQPLATAVELTRRRLEVPEIVYPFSDAGGGGRYGCSDPIPWILLITLPRLSDEPDLLFDELCAFARKLPRRPIAQQYRAVFSWLANRHGACDWIERSATSLEYLDSLAGLYPEARFLHLHRDGREAALSMREHYGFRLLVAQLYDIPDSAGAPFSALPTLEPGAPLTADDPLTRILEARAPVEYFGRLWSDQVIQGFDVMTRLDAEQVLTLRFEDLVASPEDVLEEIADFFELPGDRCRWREQAASLVRGLPARRFDALSIEEQERLDGACRPGQRLLGRLCDPEPWSADAYALVA